MNEAKLENFDLVTTGTISCDAWTIKAIESEVHIYNNTVKTTKTDMAGVFCRDVYKPDNDSIMSAERASVTPYRLGML